MSSHVKQRSLFSLLLIAIMIIVNFFNIYSLVEEQREVGKFINISGKQRMLSQRITLLSEEYYAKPDTALANKLANAVKEMRENTRYIQDESKGAVRHIFEGGNYRLAFYIESFLDKAEAFLKGNEPKESLNYLRSVNNYILKGSDTVVSVFEQQHDTYIQTVRTTSVVILMASLLLLAVLYLFFLRPSLKTNETLIEQLKNSEARIKSITDNTDATIFIKDLFGQYLFINKRFEKAFHTTNEAIAGLTDHQFFSPAEADIFVKNDRKVIRSERKISTEEFAIIEGKRHYFLVDKFPVYKGNGEIYGVCGVATDITELKQLQTTMQEYVKLVDENVITSQTDTEGKITYVSEAFCQISGFSKEELIGKDHNIVRHKDMPKSLYKELWETITQGRTWRGEIKNRTKNGGYYWVDATISPNFDENDETIIGYTAIRQNITDQKRIEEISITDELTGLYNRRYFNQIVQEEFNRCRRDGARFSFMVMDVDNFKKYNDTYGHQMGDHVLSSIGKVLKEHTQRAGDYAFRLGGEEFGVIFRADSDEAVCKATEGIREGIEGMGIEHSKNPPYNCITASIGLRSVIPSQTPDYSTDTIYKEADERLYLAKENGRNRVETCTILKDNQ